MTRSSDEMLRDDIERYLNGFDREHSYLRECIEILEERMALKKSKEEYEYLLERCKERIK